jgi:ABC-type antimicrobial peptide transport system permease subunit
VLLGLFATAALLLAAVGIYGVLSYTVAQRTGEIGVRIALGADRRRVLSAVFARPLAQVSFGVLAGAFLVAFLVWSVMGIPSARHIVLVAAYVASMYAVCLLACVVPTRRALRVEPTEALRAEG